MAIKYITLTKEQRVELVKQSSCVISDCPKDKPFSCGCDVCAACNGYQRKNEMNEHSFTKQQLNIIKNVWNDKTGFLSDGGCRLPRALRGDLCLFTICGYLEKKWSKLNGI